MDIEKLTVKVQQALNEAHLTAVKYNHQQIEIVLIFMRTYINKRMDLFQIYSLK